MVVYIQAMAVFINQTIHHSRLTQPCAKFICQPRQSAAGCLILKFSNLQISSLVLYYKLCIGLRFDVG